MAQRQASDGKPPADDYLVIGRVVAPHGIRGEVRVAIETDNPERFARQEAVYLGEARRRVNIQAARPHQGRMLVLFEGVGDRNAAESLRGQIIYALHEELEPLEEGAYYYHQVEGLMVVDEQGVQIGTLTEILVTGANDVYVVCGPAGEWLIPAIRDVVLRIDPQQGRVVVRIPPGLEPRR